MNDVSTPKRTGRPKKALPASTSKMTIELRTSERDYIEKTAKVLNLPVGKLVRIAVATHADLVPLLVRQHQDMAEMRKMVEDMKAMLRTIARFQAVAKRELDGGETESAATVEGFTPDFSFDGE